MDTSDSTKTTRRHFLLVAGVTTATSIAGCSGQGATQTPDDTPTETPTPTATETETPTETETETATETETETTTTEEGPRYDNLKQVYNQELYSSEVRGDIDASWDQIEQEMEEQGHDLSDPEITEEFIEDIATHAAVKADFDLDRNIGAQAVAYIAYNKIGLDPDQVLVAARTRNDQGHNTPVASILAQTQDGYTKTLYQHTENEEPQTGPNGDNLFVLSPSETPENTFEEAFADMWNPNAPRTLSDFDPDGIKSTIRHDVEDEDIDAGSKDQVQDAIGRLNDNIVVGANYKDESEISYTPEAFPVVGDVVDPNDINEAPEAVGEVAHGLEIEASMFYYNNVAHEDEAYMEVDYTGDTGVEPAEYSAEDFDFSVVNEERKEELEHGLMDDFLSSTLG
ncbi:hypothetical protein [Halorhabdus salina]|uniref:hypothetical protein n=1 Tax=Halorhabdus salina TaxID=2750670 RepID=UPI0015EF0405|nr:hypothetical protein [Halorhabdus salina]